MAKTDFKFAHPLRVRWAEVDKQGVVFNGHYLAYFDVAVTEYYRAIGLRYPDDLLNGGSDLFAKKALLEYHAAAEYDDELELCARVARIGRSSMQFLLEIHRGEQLLVSGELIYVNADPATRTSAPVPAMLRERIIAFERVPPQ